MTKKKTEDVEVVEPSPLAHEEPSTAPADYCTSDHPMTKAEFEALPKETAGQSVVLQDPSAAVANSTDTPEKVASDYLNSARRQLEHVGHYETNEVVKLIDLALKMLKLCEESDEP